MIITLTEFFNKLKETPDLPGVFHITIVLQEAAPLFLEQLLKFCKNFIKNIIVLDTELSESEVRLKLSTSFLGARYFYWCTTQSYHFAQTYAGPHCLVTVNIESVNHNNYDLNQPSYWVINLPAQLDKVAYTKIYSYFYSVHDKNKDSFEHLLFTRSSYYSLDHAVMLMGYQALLEQEPLPIQQRFFDLWYDHVIEQSFSLFKLSDLLLSRATQQFFALWDKHKALQPIDYWLSFWSTQLFSAASFVVLAHQLGTEQAKRMITRLPFSFINKHWRNYSFQELAQAHAALYQLDTINKLNPQGLEPLELWYHRFLLHRFDYKTTIDYIC